MLIGRIPSLFATTSATKSGYPWGQAALPGLAGVRRAVVQSADSLRITPLGGTLIVAQCAFAELPLVSGAWLLVRAVL